MKKPRWKKRINQDFCEECGNRLEDGICGICKKFEDREAEPVPQEVVDRLKRERFLRDLLSSPKEVLDRLKYDSTTPVASSTPVLDPWLRGEPTEPGHFKALFGFTPPPGARIFYFKGQARYGCPHCEWDTYNPQLYVEHVKWNHNGGKE